MLRAGTYRRFLIPHQPAHSTVQQIQLADECTVRNGTGFSDDTETGKRAGTREAFQALCEVVKNAANGNNAPRSEG